MALSDIMKLRAKAKAAGIKSYASMNANELREALNGSGSKSAAKTAVKTASGRKTATKTAGRKTASAKSAPAKSAKRPTTGTRKSTPTRTAKSTPKAEQPKRGRPKGSGTKTAVSGRSKTYHGGRNLIDNSEIDWTKEWKVSGIRGEIFKVLKKFKGNTDKTFEALAPRAQEFWKKKRNGDRIPKDAALNTLRWNISRVKFDFAMATKQHKPSKKFGTLGTGQNAKKSAPARKSTPAKATPQKRSQSRAGARKSTGRKTTGRKTAGRK